MPHGLPDFWQGTIAGMPTIGAGQVAWYMSDAKVVGTEGHEDLINYVVPDTFELHVCSGTVSCDSPRMHRYDLRQTPAATWVSPTGHSDPDGKWFDEEKAYDKDIYTFTYIIAPPESWSSYLILPINETYIDKIRCFSKLHPTIATSIDIDVDYEGGWHDVYEGLFADRVWIEKAIPAGTKLVSRARIRYYNTFTSNVYQYLYEFQFNTSGISAQEGVYFDTQAIIPYIPQAPYIVEPGATFAVRMHNDDPDDIHNMTVALAGFLQQKVGV